MKPYIEFTGTLQNCGFGLVQVGLCGKISSGVDFFSLRMSFQRLGLGAWVLFLTLYHRLIGADCLGDP